MPRPRRAPAAARLVDSSAVRAAPESDRAPAIRNRKEARQYNQLQDVYAAALGPLATSARTRVKPQYVRVPAPRRAKAPVASVSQPQLPAPQPGQPTKAAVERKRRAKAEAEVRRGQPGPYAFKRSELAAVQRLQAQGVRLLTTCIRERKKTLNYDAKVVPYSVHGERRWRMESKCRSCHAAKSTFLAAGANAPATVHGGSLKDERTIRRGGGSGADFYRDPSLLDSIDPRKILTRGLTDLVAPGCSTVPVARSCVAPWETSCVSATTRTRQMTERLGHPGAGGRAPYSDKKETAPAAFEMDPLRVVNFYKYVPKTWGGNVAAGAPYPLQQRIQLPGNLKLLICSKTGSMKTNLALNFIRWMRWKRILLFSAMTDETLYRLLQEQGEKEGLEVLASTSLADLPPVEELASDEPTCVIIDDQIGKKVPQNVLDLFQHGRKVGKWGIAVIWISQAPFKVPLEIRQNITAIACKRFSSSKALLRLFQEYDLDSSALPAYMHVINCAPEDFFLIDRETSDERMKYRHNFEPLDIRASYAKDAPLGTLDDRLAVVPVRRDRRAFQA